jgi:outer membrane protein assembly factor BamA
VHVRTYVRSFVLVALSCGLGCAHRPPTIGNACPAPQWQELAADPVASPPPSGVDEVVGQVMIEGVSADVAATLRPRLRTKPGMPIVAAPLDGDLARLVGVGITGGAHVDVRERGDNADVAFVIAPQALVGTVELAGPSRETLGLRRMTWLAGTPFEPSRISRMATAIQRAFVRDGYEDARVLVRDRLVGGAVDVCVAAAAGPRILIGKIRFPGRSAIEQHALEAALAGDDGFDVVGGFYDETKLEQAMPKLLALYYDRGYANIVADPRASDAWTIRSSSRCRCTRARSFTSAR